MTRKRPKKRKKKRNKGSGKDSLSIIKRETLEKNGEGESILKGKSTKGTSPKQK